MHGGESDWIEDGEKYALIGFNVQVGGGLAQRELSPGLWVLTDTTLDVPEHWQQWLGSIRTEQIESCNLFLMCKRRCMAPSVLDADDAELKQYVSNFYLGLLLAGYFSSSDRPILLSGARQDGEINVRQHESLDLPRPRLFGAYPSITSDRVLLAAKLGEKLNALPNTPPHGGYRRLLRTLQVYVRARTTADVLNRLHQYCRSIEGLILPDVGRTRQQFRSRTELFIGPNHHDLMGLAYEVRSAVEHLHESRYLEPFDREQRLDLVRKEAILELIARTALARVLRNDTLLAHFANTLSLAAFWSLPPDERVRTWGDTIDPQDALVGFDPANISDRQLGGP